MNPLTVEWIAKAEADLATARRELRVRKSPNYDAVCFHSQQGAEKLLKAALTERGLSFSKTHDLARLLGLLIPEHPALAVLNDICSDLSAYAVEFRYPGENATKAMARIALKNSELVHEEILANLQRG